MSDDESVRGSSPMSRRGICGDRGAWIALLFVVCVLLVPTIALGMLNLLTTRRCACHHPFTLCISHRSPMSSVLAGLVAVVRTGQLQGSSTCLNNNETVPGSSSEEHNSDLSSAEADILADEWRELVPAVRVRY
jgi:hypothetical protein